MPGAATGNWKAVYGDYADEYFHTWAIASYIEQVAKAGRAVYDLPMYVNDALRNPIEAARALEEQLRQRWPALRRDRHLQGRRADDRHRRARHLQRRVQAGGTTFGSTSAPTTRCGCPRSAMVRSTRATSMVLGAGSIGVTPFGLDYFPYYNYPLARRPPMPAWWRPSAKVFKVCAHPAPMGRLGLCRQDLGRRRADDRALQKIEMGDWVAELSYRQWMFGEESWTGLDKRPHNDQPRGGVAIAEIAPDHPRDRSEHSRAPCRARDLAGMQLRVEQGRFRPMAAGRWNASGTATRWTGGLNLMDEPLVLKVTMGRLPK